METALQVVAGLVLVGLSSILLWCIWIVHKPFRPQRRRSYRRIRTHRHGSRRDWDRPWD